MEILNRSQACGQVKRVRPESRSMVLVPKSINESSKVGWAPNIVAAEPVGESQALNNVKRFMEPRG